MNRTQIRTYTRTLADELGEAPDGLFYDTELDTLIEIAQAHVYADLLKHLPWFFRKPALISLTAEKADYVIWADLSVADFFLMEDILRNRAGERPDPLLHVEIDQLGDHVKVGETGDPRIWYYSGQGQIGFGPTPAATEANRFKAFYFPSLPALADDDASPALPAIAHPLVSVRVLLDWATRDGESPTRILNRYDQGLIQTIDAMGWRQGTTYEPRTPHSEMRSR